MVQGVRGPGCPRLAASFGAACRRTLGPRIRKLPGVLGDDESAVEESFSAALEGAPEYPHYTRPAEWRGWTVPDVLLSGHHARVREWRLEQARSRAHKRPLP